MPIPTSPATPDLPIRRVFIVHGYGANPENHWFPWLRDLLTSHGIDATVVPLPESHAPSAAAWHKAISSAVDPVDDQTWIVAHSLGAITVLRRLAELPAPWVLGGVILVSGFTGRLEVLPDLDDFLADDVDLAAVVSNVRHRHMVYSDNDAVVPPSASAALANRLQAQTHVIEGAGHFLDTDGLTTLPAVSELLRVAETFEPQTH